MILSRAYVLNLCPPGIAGSFAAVMFAAPNVGQVTGPMAAGGISSKVGDAACVIIMAILYGVPTLLLFPFPPRSIEEKEIGGGKVDPINGSVPPFDRANSLIVENNLDQGTSVTYERLEDDTLVPRTFSTLNNTGHQQQDEKQNKKHKKHKKHKHYQNNLPVSEKGSINSHSTSSDGTAMNSVVEDD